VTETPAANLARFAEGGGTLAVGFHSGMVDENGHVFLGGYPGAFRDVLGVHTDELFPLLPGRTTGLTGEVPPGATADLWSERVRLAGAQAVASYADGPLAGHPAVTRHRYGRGTAWYWRPTPTRTPCPPSSSASVRTSA
jgi:beta-galactosidase